MNAVHRIIWVFCVICVITTTAVPRVSARMLEVGDGKPFQSIEQAVAAAKAGDEVVIHAKKDGSAYLRPVLLIRTPKLTIRAANAKKPVVLDGAGYDYSGRGSIPRAIIQFEPGADGCVVDGLTLINAANESFNGAGVRINQANNVTIRNCVIRNNEMGIMSNGEVAKKTGAGQVIEKCVITQNGTEKHAGYNHNLYLGGFSVMVRECDISKSLTGHNVKSRAHLNFIFHNKIYHSANRELDLVDEKENTAAPGSDSYLIGNTIRKDPNCGGNRTVLHFGQDGGAAHNGTVWLIENKIQTPFISPVVHVSSGNGVIFIKNTLEGQNGVLAKLEDVKMTAKSSDNQITGRFVVQTPGGEKAASALEKAPAVPKEVTALLQKKNEPKSKK